MQRPVRGVRVGFYLTHSHRSEDVDNIIDRLSRSNSEETDDAVSHTDILTKSKTSSVPTLIEVSSDNPAPIQKVVKGNVNTSNQKAILPQLNVENHRHERPTKDKPFPQWFPKVDSNRVDSNDSVPHNPREQCRSPTLLTTIPLVGIPPARPGASTLSTSSIKTANSNSVHAAFQPIHSLCKSSSNTIHEQAKTKSQSIPKHQLFKQGQKLSRVHISHARSPSVVHLMLNDDFTRACRLLHKMAAHPELGSDDVPHPPFSAKVNQICACSYEGRWFRCRILQISADSLSAEVVCSDWGMANSVQIDPAFIRPLPAEFSIDPVCSIVCRLDGVPETNDSVSDDLIAQCIGLLSENEYDVLVTDVNETTGTKIILSMDGRIINDEIRDLLSSRKFPSSEEDLIEQFHHELQLSIDDECKALLSSFSGKDDSFYVLVINESTAAIDRTINELQEHHIPNREFLQIPQIKTLVVARYADDDKCYRAWVKAIDIDQEQATVFFVDYGNESQVLFADIYICPESIRTLPWLGIRVRLSNEIVTVEELTRFWKLTESHYIWIRVNEIFNDSYGVQIKIDYTAFLRHERMKVLPSKTVIHQSVQTNTDSQNPLSNETFLRILFEMISNELRSLRHRLNGSDESSQDRHAQLMQLLFSLTTSNCGSSISR